MASPRATQLPTYAGGVICCAVLLGLALTVAPLGCSYTPTFSNCRIPCSNASPCPSDLSCNGGFCSRGNQACPLASADGAAGGGPAQSDGSSEGSGDATTPICTGTTQACGTVCFDIGRSPQHCGQCGHDCGGGDCVAGQCQPMILVEHQPRTGSPADLVVDETDLTFNAGTRLLRIPKSGSNLAPKTVGDLTPDEPGLLAMSADKLFVETHSIGAAKWSLLACPKDGCPAPAPVLTALPTYGVQKLVATQTAVYWMNTTSIGRSECPTGAAVVRCAAQTVVTGDLTRQDIRALTVSDTEVFFAGTWGAQTGLMKCPLIGCGVAAPTLLAAPPTGGTVEDGIYAGGLVFALSPAPPNMLYGSIRTCAPQDCEKGTPRLFVPGRTFEYAWSIEANDLGLYWSENVSDGSAGAIRTCPLSGCVLGPQDVTTGRLQLGNFRIDASFAYWIESETTAVDGPFRIMRVRLPL